MINKKRNFNIYNNFSYDNTLQGLRGVAILLIVLSHCNYIQNEFGNNIFGAAGGLGVQLFIILSGYLMMLNFNRSNKIPSFALNIKKKLNKFYPLHFITLIFALPFLYKSFLYGSFKSAIEKIVLKLLLLQSYIPDMDIYFSLNATSWYLSTNFFFIILTPFVIKFINFTASKINVVFAIFIIIVIQYLLFYFFADNKHAHWLLYICPVVRMLDFVLGWYTYVAGQKSEIIGAKIGLLAIFWNIILLYFSAFSNSMFYCTAAWSIPNVLLFLSLISSKKHNYLKEKILNTKLLVFIGNISFEIFLIHQLVFRYMAYIFKTIGLPNSILIYLFGIIITIILSVLYKENENKILKCVIR